MQSAPGKFYRLGKEQTIMQAVFFDAINKMRIGTADIPRPGDEDVLVKVRSAGICGTDVHILKGEYGSLPTIPGHEWTGEVAEVGKAVTKVKPGDIVVVAAAGGFADYVRARERNVHKIGDLTYDEGALIEPLSCVVNGIDTAGVHLGDEVLIMGAGPIGLLLLQVAKLAGAQSVAVADIFEEKLVKAKALGADEVFVAGKDLKEQVLDAHPKGFHLTIDGTGNTKAQEQLPRLTRARGRFLLFGVADPGATMTIEPYDIFNRRLQIIGVHSFEDKFERAVGLAKARRLNLADIVSHHFPLGEFPKALELMRGPEPSLKILIHPGADS